VPRKALQSRRGHETDDLQGDEMMFMPGTYLTPRTGFAFKVNGKGREVTFKADQRFWIGNSRTDQASSGSVEVCRINRPAGFGYRFTQAQIEELFVVAE
jgi:hypothetical protein